MRQEDESNMDKPFGGKVVVLGGDFKQILSVIPKEGRQDIVSAVVNSSDLWKHCENPLLDLVDFTFPNLVHNMKIDKFLEEQCILCPTLESVENVNDFILEFLPGDTDEDTEYESKWFTIEFLNDITCSGIPNHKITLKVGAPIMLLRNIDQATDLCNGTRLIVSDLGTNVTRVTVLTRTNNGDDIFIPRKDMVPSDLGYLFKFERRQFSISPCFAMTINKSQAQSLSHIGLYLFRPVFTHGQFYVALSSVRLRNELKLLVMGAEGKVRNKTETMVYKKMSSNIWDL
ncbi:uncharacterized protein LOC130720040 [Lotus japonicus]|uniref:uncharacterized protein LOC130720040 n=1 Tax=Lotus japonicus TaxID=34305 RepID=UPI0025838730|nr:uncharacterized protein LOC130720040 [Lotus japonicus]